MTANRHGCDQTHNVIFRLNKQIIYSCLKCNRCIPGHFLGSCNQSELFCMYCYRYKKHTLSHCTVHKVQNCQYNHIVAATNMMGMYILKQFSWGENVGKSLLLNPHQNYCENQIHNSRCVVLSSLEGRWDAGKYEDRDGLRPIDALSPTMVPLGPSIA